MIDHDLHDHDEDFEYVGADDDDNQHMDHVYKTIIPITMTIYGHGDGYDNFYLQHDFDHIHFRGV